MDRQFIFDVTDAPPTRFSLGRGISSLGGIYIYGLFGLFAVLPVAIPTVFAAVEVEKAGGDTFWYYAALWALTVTGPVIGLLLFYWRNARRGRRALRKIRVFGRSLREARAALRKHRAAGRGVLLVLNLSLAIGLPYAAHYGFDAFNRTRYGDIPVPLVGLASGALVLNGLRLWGDRASFVRTFVLIVAIAAAWIAWFALIVNLQKSNEAAKPDGLMGFVQLAGYLVSFVLLVGLTGSLWARARGSMDDMLKRDKRPPILYLRSFDDEGSEGGSVAERELYDALRAYGPFIAIGRPGDLRPAGAARKLVSDAEWRDVVLKLMKRAGAIVVVPGMTKGLDWEIGQIAGNWHLSKTVFFFPPKPDSGERYARLTGLLGNGPEAQALARLRPGKTLAISHIGEAGWTNAGWLSVTSEYANTGVYEAAVDTALYGMWVAAREQAPTA